MTRKKIVFEKKTVEISAKIKFLVISIPVVGFSYNSFCRIGWSSYITLISDVKRELVHKIVFKFKMKELEPLHRGITLFCSNVQK